MIRYDILIIDSQVDSLKFSDNERQSTPMEKCKILALSCKNNKVCTQ